MSPPRISRPPEPVLLNTSSLGLLANCEEKGPCSRVQEFVVSQKRFAKAQANEGRAVHASWDLNTPEKEKTRLHQPSAGFETPVLIPRMAQSQSKPSKRLPTPPQRLESTAEQSKTEQRGMGSINPGSPQPRSNSTGKLAEKRIGPRSSRKGRRPRSDTDEEHLTRLAERRQRKRAKREIMGARDEATSNAKGEKENKMVPSKEPKGKKQKIPAGLALMHGFSSTSVGKNRLTIEPPPSFGVFNKGRASAKVEVTKSKRSKRKGFPSRVFSEDRFLRTKPTKTSAGQRSGHESSDTSSSGSATEEHSSEILSAKGPSVQLRKREIKAKGTKRPDSPTVPTDCDSEVDVGGADAGAVHQSRNYDALARSSGKVACLARSASWDIEREDGSLPSTSPDVVAPSTSKAMTALLDVRATAWGKVLEREQNRALSPRQDCVTQATAPISFMPPTEKPRSPVLKPLPELTKVVSSIGPWESASQVVQNSLLPQDLRVTRSKFFSGAHKDDPVDLTSIPSQRIPPLGGPEHQSHACHGTNASMTLDQPLANETGIDEDFNVVADAAGGSMLEDLSIVPDVLAVQDEHFSAIQTSSLDSFERAIRSLDVPAITYIPQTRRKSTQQRHSNHTLEENSKDDLGIPNDFLEPAFPTPAETGIEDQLGPMDTAADYGVNALIYDNSSANCYLHLGSLSFDDVGWDGVPDLRHDHPAAHMDDQPGVPRDSAAHVDRTLDDLSSVQHDYPDEVLSEFSSREVRPLTSWDCAASLASANWAGSEGLGEEPARDRLWESGTWLAEDGASSPSESDDAGEDYAHLTAVERVEFDVARRLRGHWHPQRF
ncbi:hypothetical protein BC834DRAFT_865652 [Gloeopeniophorella convolvens]|nr:hypothetical protein BC834DRAFT_865652 [Gloeopeniophorella convolvens]